MSFPCQKIDECPQIFSGYTENVNPGCTFAISAGPDQNLSLGIICSSGGGPPSPCSPSINWPVAPVGLPYTNTTGETASTTTFAGTIVTSGSSWGFVPGDETWFYLNSVAVGDFDLTFDMTEPTGTGNWNVGLILFNGDQDNSYRIQIVDDSDTGLGAHAELACGSMVSGYSEYYGLSFIDSTPLTPHKFRFLRSNSLVAVYFDNVLVMCVDTGLTENANIGFYVLNQGSHFTDLLISNVNLQQA